MAHFSATNDKIILDSGIQINSNCDNKCTLTEEIEFLKNERAILQFNLAIYKQCNEKIKEILEHMLKECIVTSPAIEPDSDND